MVLLGEYGYWICLWCTLFNRGAFIHTALVVVFD